MGNKKNFLQTKHTTCKFSLRPSLVRPSLLMLSQLTPSRTLRPRSKTRKVFLQISKDSSSLVSNSRMAEPFPTTTSKRSPLSISSSDSEVECKSSSRPSLVRPSPSMLSQLIPLRTSRPRFKTRKVSLQISKDLSSLESNLRMEEPSPTTTSKRSPLSISSSDSEVECKFSSRPSLVRPSPLMSSQLTPSRTSRPRSRTRRESHQTSRDLSSLVSNSRTEELFLTTTSRRNLPFTWCSDSEVDSEITTIICCL